MSEKEVGNWLEQAEHDIEVAEYNLNGNMLAAFYSEDFLAIVHRKARGEHRAI